MNSESILINSSPEKERSSQKKPVYIARKTSKLPSAGNSGIHKDRKPIFVKGLIPTSYDSAQQLMIDNEEKKRKKKLLKEKFARLEARRAERLNLKPPKLALEKSRNVVPKVEIMRFDESGLVEAPTQEKPKIEEKIFTKPRSIISTDRDIREIFSSTAIAKTEVEMKPLCSKSFIYQKKEKVKKLTREEKRNLMRLDVNLWIAEMQSEME
ncbi:Oidioi.mRNA.OKI2018_I69.PAR.g12958.t1.cds [Oikopleura dioica]|uniref:Oidioi.mRNA.OKI2018_I69.PAR.g12958.t1.cds n=1 Tax=Oikopleura dioica TaxID=34765 RepID=A0ABN7S2J7_OIKDI|nr:Oidioi.mRNA.OKI2018_I69.PAR.g12958.t1.cds [Oikopleura dioica]